VSLNQPPESPAAPGRVRVLLGAVGPGLLMAGAAIGVSHLVQSTRAGADFGFQLVLVVLAVNLFKYPFFEYGHRWAVATGTSLLDGYLLLGRGTLWLFFVLNTVTAVISVAGVTFVTAALAENFLHLGASATAWSAALMIGCALLVLIGHYRWLDRSMKLIMALLVVATVTAFVVAVIHGPVAPAGFRGPNAYTAVHLGFLIALMGWMPAPIELSVWQSLWVRAADESRGRRASRREASFDFNFGYGLTLVLALLFLALGALVMHGSGESFSESSVAFSAQLVHLYEHTLGSWSAPIVALAAFTAMLSTTLTVIDAYPRSLAVATRLTLPRVQLADSTLHGIWIAACCLAALLIIHSFLGHFTGLIDLATTIAFLAAPVFAWINFRLLTSRHTPAQMRPGTGLRLLSWAGLTYFVVFGLLYLARLG
jgi:Mn2+/Fe2+ NRAMP family transporter